MKLRNIDDINTPLHKIPGAIPSQSRLPFQEGDSTEKHFSTIELFHGYWSGPGVTDHCIRCTQSAPWQKTNPWWDINQEIIA